MRLFVAVPLPRPVAELVAALPRPGQPGLWWSTRAQWHVTLRFLGPVPAEEVVTAMPGVLGWLDGEVPTAEMGPATAWFPGRRVLQVPVAGLDHLAAAVTRVTEAWGPGDTPSFAGHLTLARTRGRRRGPAALAGAPLRASFTVTEIGVYDSRPGPDGPVYERLSRLPLVPPGPY